MSHFTSGQTTVWKGKGQLVALQAGKLLDSVMAGCLWLGLDPPLYDPLWGHSFCPSGSHRHLAGRTLTFSRSLYSQTKWQTPKPTARFYRWETEAGSRLTLGDRNWVPEDKFKGHCWVHPLRLLDLSVPSLLP